MYKIKNNTINNNLTLTKKSKTHSNRTGEGASRSMIPDIEKILPEIIDKTEALNDLKILRELKMYK